MAVARAPSCWRWVLVLGLVLIMAPYHALLGFLARVGAAGARRWRYLVGLPALWLLIEWRRGWFLSGFPWLSLGYSQTDTWLAALRRCSACTAFRRCCCSAAARWWRCCAARARRAAAGRGRCCCCRGRSGWHCQRIDWTHAAGAADQRRGAAGGGSAGSEMAGGQRRADARAVHATQREALGAQLIVWPEAALPELANEMPQYLGQQYSAARAHGSDIVMGILRRR